MKRIFPTGLVLLLVMSSLGHVLAAALCPRAFGHECCFAKTLNHTHGSSSTLKKVTDMHMHGMSMDGINMDEMSMGDASMNQMPMNDSLIDAPTVVMSIAFSPPSVSEAVANKVVKPVDSCAHCLGHSGIVNAPFSFVSASDQSGKEIRSDLLPVSRFQVRPEIAPAPIGLPWEHAPPPGGSAPRHILISVFLI